MTGTLCQRMSRDNRVIRIINVMRINHTSVAADWSSSSLPLPLPLLLLLLLLLPFLRWMAHLHEMRTQARVASHHSLAVRVGLQHSFVDYGV